MRRLSGLEGDVGLVGSGALELSETLKEGSEGGEEVEKAKELKTLSFLNLDEIRIARRRDELVKPSLFRKTVTGSDPIASCAMELLSGIGSRIDRGADSFSTMADSNGVTTSPNVESCSCFATSTSEFCASSSVALVDDITFKLSRVGMRVTRYDRSGVRK